jgi:Rad3-related DNA helicase
MLDYKDNIRDHLSTALNFTHAELLKAETANNVAKPLAQKMKDDAEQMAEQARELYEKARILFDEAHQLESTTDGELKQWQTIVRNIERARDSLLRAPNKEEKRRSKYDR